MFGNKMPIYLQDTDPSGLLDSVVKRCKTDEAEFQEHLAAILCNVSVCPPPHRDREFFIDKPLVRIHLIIEMILVDRPCAMGV